MRHNFYTIHVNALGVGVESYEPRAYDTVLKAIFGPENVQSALPGVWWVRSSMFLAEVFEKVGTALFGTNAPSAMLLVDKVLPAFIAFNSTPMATEWYRRVSQEALDSMETSPLAVVPDSDAD